jgi:hypothetical protein
MYGDGDSEGQWVTYAELAAARGIDRQSAAKLSFRRRWQRQKDNQGMIRICVPPEWLRPERDASADGSGNGSGDMSTALAAYEDAKAAFAEGLKQAEARADQDRQRADRVEKALDGERSRAEALRDKLEQARAEARHATEVAKSLRQAEAARRGLGRLARLRAAWRGE